MSTNDQDQPNKKKISLQEAIQQQLANKKAKQTQNKENNKWSNTNQTMKSQQTKKINNQRKRQGV
ncbi:hypothetical protein BKP45_01035 [Anaerobacillus alkalidiazotrophicus]|uniref:Uncharacterized protein n=1 Tax=Anaerobacillus alkalidiazotrophicus TaxID=472963 RepID=A0A1S2MCI9_9BACI|nr:hypothetical protein [Anaerobacillus alkalidiazotrophicus]OIJ21395.1 hypothetical protein BKP45_01035 [Anaerobacillus alkalidiazotrophicus]